MSTHWYRGMRRTGRIAVWTVGQWVSLWESHVYPLVQWDGTDRWAVDQPVGIPCVPFAKHHVGLGEVLMSQWTFVGKTGQHS